MIRCDRCGVEDCAWFRDRESGCTSANTNALDCRDRELANLRSLLRSVTGQLEEACDLLDPPHGPHCASAARNIICSALEALS